MFKQNVQRIANLLIEDGLVVFDDNSNKTLLRLAFTGQDRDVLDRLTASADYAHPMQTESFSKSDVLEMRAAFCTEPRIHGADMDMDPNIGLAVETRRALEVVYLPRLIPRQFVAIHPDHIDNLGRG
jgi:hypothetical protein